MAFADTRTPALEFNNASFTYGGPPVLTGVTGTLYPGEALALIGPTAPEKPPSSAESSAPSPSPAP